MIATVKSMKKPNMLLTSTAAQQQRLRAEAAEKRLEETQSELESSQAAARAAAAAHGEHVTPVKYAQRDIHDGAWRSRA